MKIKDNINNSIDRISDKVKKRLDAIKNASSTIID